MPGMDGETLALKIKTLSPYTPVIMITGLVPYGGCRGVDATLRKPFTHAALTALIIRSLAGVGSVVPLPPVD